MFRLILQNIEKRMINSVSVVLLIATSTMLLFALVLCSLGAYQGITLSKEQNGAEVMLVPKDASTEASDTTLLFTGAPYNVYMSEDALSEADGLFGVERVTSQFFCQTLAMSCCSTDTETRIIGVDFDTDWTLQPLTSLDLSNGLGDGEVLLGSRVGGNSDNTVSLLGQKYSIAGRLEPTGSDIDLCIIMGLQQARDLSSSRSEFDHYWEEYGDPNHIISVVLVDLQDDLDENGVKRAISHLKNVTDAKVVVRSQVVDQSQESLATMLTVMLFATGLIVIVALLQLFSRYYSMTWQRRSEFALYRIIGATQKYLAQLISGEALLLSMTGAAIGLVAGFFIYKAGQTMLFAGGSFPFIPPSVGVMVASAAAIVALWLVATLLSVLSPLRQIKRISLALAMRQNYIM